MSLFSLINGPDLAGVRPTIPTAGVEQTIYDHFMLELAGDNEVAKRATNMLMGLETHRETTEEKIKEDLGETLFQQYLQFKKDNQENIARLIKRKKYLAEYYDA